MTKGDRFLVAGIGLLVALVFIWYFPELKTFAQGGDVIEFRFDKDGHRVGYVPIDTDGYVMTPNGSPSAIVDEDDRLNIAIPLWNDSTGENSYLMKTVAGGKGTYLVHFTNRGVVVASTYVKVPEKP